MTDAARTRSGDPARQQIRGSSLLMAGRVIALGLNFLVQVLTVRYLSKLDYGAFAFALAVVSLSSTLSLVGMDKAVARFAPGHHERRDHGKLIGTLLVMLFTILALGLGIIGTVFVFRGPIGERLVTDPLSLTVLVILIATAPVGALNSFLESTFAVLARPRYIFFRRHVVGPLLKLAAVLWVMASQGDVRQLALAYVVAGLLGVTIGFTLLLRVLREQGLFADLRLRDIELRWREIYGFGLPMLGSDMVLLLRSSLVVLLLGMFHPAASVAAFSAVLPVARLNRVVMESFGVLFMAGVSRLAARGQTDAIGDVYWRSVTWVTVLSFPIFGMTFAFAGPTTVALFGQRYADSGVIMAILSVGFFVHATLGLSARGLKAIGRLRYIMTIDTVSIVLAVVLNLMLIPRFGALGGAIAVASTLILHNVLSQAGLAVTTGVVPFHWRHVKVWVGVSICTAGLVAIDRLTSPALPVAAALVGLAWFGLLLVARDGLQVRETFPELLRVPFVGRLLESRTSLRGRLAEEA